MAYLSGYEISRCGFCGVYVKGCNFSDVKYDANLVIGRIIRGGHLRSFVERHDDDSGVSITRHMFTITQDRKIFCHRFTVTNV